MKKIIIFVILIVSACFVSAQTIDTNNNIVREGKTFVKQTSTKTRVSDTTCIRTEYKYKDAKNIEHTVWLTTRGSAFIRRISGKTGAEYKQYLGENISREICRELGIAYKPKKKS